MRPQSIFLKSIFITLCVMTGLLYTGCKSDQIDPVSLKTYYWSLDEKIEVEIHPNVVSLRDSRALNQKEIAEILGIEEKMIVSITRVHPELLRIHVNQNYLKFSEQTIPALSLNGSPNLMTGEISLMPEPNTDVNVLIEKYNLQLVQKTNYGSYLFLAPNPSQTLSLANTIQEKENVKWAAPNFLSLYTNFI